MIIIVGTVSTRKGHKVHRCINGWAACGAGKLNAAPRNVRDDDQLCQRCAPHLHTAIVWEIDDMRRRGNLARVATLETFRDSGMSATQHAAREALIAEISASVVASWQQQARPTMLPTPDPYVGAIPLF